MKNIILEPQQKKAVYEISQWWRSPFRKPYFVLSGCGGSGKSTLIQYFIEEIGIDSDRVARITLTGKAAQRLQELGHSTASTIHSKIYYVEPYEDPKTGEEKIRIKLRERDEMAHYDLIIVDECSMIGEELLNDLLFFNKPILFIGDHNQLEPIGDICILLERPDVRLDVPVRQAEGNSIITLSQHVLRKGTAGLKFGKFGDNVDIISNPDIGILDKVDQIITGKHVTRRRINSFMKLNKTGDYPVKGDKIICKKNQWDEMLMESDGKFIFLTNGLIGECLNDVTKHKRNIHFMPDLSVDKQHFDIPFDFDYLIHNKFLMQNKDLGKFDYGYAITCHSSQGSEFAHPLVIAEPLGRDNESRRRWLYTAVTRAVEHLTIVL